MNLVAIGDNCLDVYFQTDETFVGGNAFNVAMNWAISGRDARYVGAVGSDAAAPLVRAAAIEHGLSATDIHRVAGPTGVTLIALEGSDRRFVYEEFGVGAAWQPPRRVVESAQPSDWVHVAGVNRNSGLIPALKDRGAAVSVDLSTFGDFSSIEGVDIAFASCPDSLDAADELAQRVVDAGARIAVVTAGSAGSVALLDGRALRTQAHPVAVVDTCGAGDSYIAAVIGALTSGAALDDAMESGAMAASVTCTHRGGYPQSPSETLPWIIDTYYPHARMYIPSPAPLGASTASL